jgi:hypothetical protein
MWQLVSVTDSVQVSIYFIICRNIFSEPFAVPESKIFFPPLVASVSRQDFSSCFHLVANKHDSDDSYNHMETCIGFRLTISLYMGGIQAEIILQSFPFYST